MKLSDYILAQNDYQFTTLQKKYPGKKILKVHNPIIVDKDHLISKPIPSGYFALIANFRYQKNLRLLYEIVMLLPKEQFKIAANPNSTVDLESKEYMEKLQTLPNVEFIGKTEREDILQFLKNSKISLPTQRFKKERLNNRIAFPKLKEIKQIKLLINKHDFLIL